MSSELDRLIAMHHVAIELMGVIKEFRTMPCGSLESRMFATVDRYERKVRENAPTSTELDFYRVTQQQVSQELLLVGHDCEITISQPGQPQITLKATDLLSTKVMDHSAISVDLGRKRNYEFNWHEKPEGKNDD